MKMGKIKYLTICALILLILGAYYVFSTEDAALSDYPSFLTKGSHVTLVVGDKSSSINVVAQTYILSSLSNINKKNKLASEVADLSQNIISIGNPCINEISAKIMNDPEPCDKDFQRGKAHIRLYQNNGFYHIIVAGYTDLGTKKAAEILADYKNYKLEGNEFAFEFSGDNGDRLAEEKESLKPQMTEQAQPKNVETEDTDANAKITTKEDTLIEAKKENKAVEQPKLENKIESKAEEKKQPEKEGIIAKLITWFSSLFKK